MRENASRGAGRGSAREARNALQGHPIRHPLHPALVHFPIGLFVLSLVFDLLGLRRRGAGDMARGAYAAMIGGVLTALAAAIPGLVDWLDIRRDHPAKKVATAHMLLNLSAVGLYLANLAERSRAPARAVVSAPARALSLAGMGILSISGYLGGGLVYGDGIGVGRHRRPAGTPDETVEREPERAGAWVALAPSERLGEGETLRADVDGYVMAIARHDGEVYGFQEFCTHRFGPLSEGLLHDGQIMCPWHRSCFDVRTGEVTAGPAKVGLRTFSVREADGRIEVQLPAGREAAREQVVAPNQTASRRD